MPPAASNLNPAAGESPGTLLTGIVADVQRLIDQQLRLMRREVERDVKQAGRGGLVLVVGAGMLLLSLASFGSSLALGLHNLTSPVGDPAVLPLWACHALVGALLLVASGVCFYLGRNWIGQLQPLQQTAAAAEETIEWATNQN
jgi:hypothetical protein